ncbi:MAG: hypothetical protein L6R48_17585 [Planctomycetes bacterium]|nr:hypothetical protein [Planctomycetota bacterium]
MAALLLPVGADGIRLGLVAAPDGGDRRVLAAEARALLARLAAAIAGPGGRLEECATGPRGAGGWAGLGLSLAYAGSRALAGAAPGGALGVDLVEDRAPPGWQAVAELYLPPRWRAGLDAEDFPAAWARWEAWLKCRRLALAEHPADPPETPTSVRLLRPAPGLVAALATA